MNWLAKGMCAAALTQIDPRLQYSALDQFLPARNAAPSFLIGLRMHKTIVAAR